MRPELGLGLWGQRGRNIVSQRAGRTQRGTDGGRGGRGDRGVCLVMGGEGVLTGLL